MRAKNLVCKKSVCRSKIIYIYEKGTLHCRHFLCRYMHEDSVKNLPISYFFYFSPLFCVTMSIRMCLMTRHIWTRFLATGTVILIIEDLRSQSNDTSSQLTIAEINESVEPKQLTSTGMFSFIIIIFFYRSSFRRTFLLLALVFQLVVKAS